MRLVSVAIKLILAAAVVWPTIVLGHEFSPEEQEVWDFIEQCQEAFKEESEAAHDCFHDDFLGWQYPDLVPRNAEAQRKFARLQFETTEIRGQDVRPVGIRIYGRFAVAHYYVQSVVRGQDGQDIEQRNRWTDILLKEKGRWYWIGDHGGAITVSQP